MSPSYSSPADIIQKAQEAQKESRASTPHKANPHLAPMSERSTDAVNPAALHSESGKGVEREESINEEELIAAMRSVIKEIQAEPEALIKQKDQEMQAQSDQEARRAQEAQLEQQKQETKARKDELLARKKMKMKKPKDETQNNSGTDASNKSEDSPLAQAAAEAAGIGAKIATQGEFDEKDSSQNNPIKPSAPLTQVSNLNRGGRE